MISFFKTFLNFRRDSSWTALSFSKLMSFRVSQNVFRSLKCYVRFLGTINDLGGRYDLEEMHDLSEFY